MVLTTVLSMMRYVGEIEDRDFVDRLHSYFTTNLLLGLSVLVSFKQFGGRPIECLTPDIFSGSWEQYAENFCWAQDTYFVPSKNIIEELSKKDRNERRISYYQWVPFLLLIEAACFRLPSLLWKYMSEHSGIKIQEIVKLSKDPNNIKASIRRSHIKSLTVHLQGALRFHRRINRKQIRPHKLFFFLNLTYSAYFVTLTYLVTKLLYLLNVVFQLLFMNSFMETSKYYLYGAGALFDFVNGTSWEQSGMFPRVSLCDFEVRVMGNVQSYTIQCVLVINIFNEKIFVFLWFWYAILIVFSLGSFIFWLFVFFFPYSNRRFIIRHLEMSDLPIDIEANEKLINYFTDSFLHCDGVFVVRMLTLHSGVIFGTDLVAALWQSCYGGDDQIKRSNSYPEIEMFQQNSDDDANTNEINSSKIRLRKPFSIENNKQKQINQYQTIHETIIEPPSPPAHIIKEILTPKSSIKLSKNSFSKSQNKKNQEMNDLLIKTNSNDLNKKQSNDILPIIDEEKR